MSSKSLNLSGENWITRANKAALTKVNAQTVLNKALILEKQRIEAGTHEFITFLDQAGRKARKLVKIIVDEKPNRQGSKKAS